MAEKKSTKKSFLDSFVEGAEHVISSEPVQELLSTSKKVIKVGYEKLKELDIKEMSESGKKMIDQGKDMLTGFDPKKFADQSKEVVTDFVKNPEASLDKHMQRAVGWIAKQFDLPDPKTGTKNTKVKK